MNDSSASSEPSAGDAPPAGLRRLLYGVAVLFLALHQDFWGWHNRDFVFGLPGGLTYHLVYCVAAAGLMVLLVRFAWPRDLAGEGTTDDGHEGGRR